MDSISLVRPQKNPVRLAYHCYPASASELAVEASQDVNNQELWKPFTTKNNVHPRFGIDHTRELRNHHCDTAVDSDRYQTTTAFSNNLSASAFIASSPTNIRDGSLIIPGHLAFSLLTIVIFLPTRIMLKSVVNALVTLTQHFLTPYTLSITHTPRAHRYCCATQRRTNGNTRIRIGVYGRIPRWVKGSTLKYVVCTESFETTDIAKFVAIQATEAISTWKGIGVKFKQVDRSHAATFQIKYCRLPSDCDPDVFADAFFPGDGPGTLFIYGVALNGSNMVHLGKILAHELGHILGLRHEFAGDLIPGRDNKPRESGSVLWGSKNESSVMNYPLCPSEFLVNEQDLKELESFYDCTKKEHEGLEIHDFEPKYFLFPSEEHHTRRGLLRFLGNIGLAI